MFWRGLIKAKLTQVGREMLERQSGHIQSTFTINVWCGQRYCTPRTAVAVSGLEHVCALQGLSGWPKLRFQVWSVDSDGRTDICGYGAVTCPTTPGMYEMQCPLWVPEGTSSTTSAPVPSPRMPAVCVTHGVCSAVERFSAFFIGGRPRLVDETVVFSGNDRFRLNTIASGTVHIRIGCMLRGFLQNGVSVG